MSSDINDNTPDTFEDAVTVYATAVFEYYDGTIQYRTVTVTVSTLDTLETVLDLVQGAVDALVENDDSGAYGETSLGFCITAPAYFEYCQA